MNVAYGSGAASGHGANATAARPARRGRPRKPTTDERILSAAREILIERGFDAMSFEAVAQRAGVTRPTIYRRWASKAHLVNSLVIDGPGMPPSLLSAEIPEIIETWLGAMASRYGQADMKSGLAGLVSLYQAAPELRLELQGGAEAEARESFARSIRRNQENGHVRKSVSPDTLFDMIVGSIFYRALGTSFEASPQFIQETCDIVLQGIMTPEASPETPAPSRASRKRRRDVEAMPG